MRGAVENLDERGVDFEYVVNMAAIAAYGAGG